MLTYDYCIQLPAGLPEAPDGYTEADIGVYGREKKERVRKFQWQELGKAAVAWGQYGWMTHTLAVRFQRDNPDKKKGGKETMFFQWNPNTLAWDEVARPWLAYQEENVTVVTPIKPKPSLKPIEE